MYRFELELIIFEYLKQNPYTSIDDIRNHAISQIQAREIELSSEAYLLINVIVWDNIADRVLTPGIDINHMDLPYVHVSNMDKLDNKLIEDKDL